MSIGSVVGAKRFTGCPVLSTRNLVKFHLMALPRKPPCLSFKYLYSGAAEFPFTLIYSGKQKLVKYFYVAIFNQKFLKLFRNFCFQKITLPKTSPNSPLSFSNWQTISSPSFSGIWPAN